MTRRYIRPALLVPVLLLCAVAGAQVEKWTTLNEVWYSMELASARAGYSHVLQEQQGDVIRTTTTTKMTIARAGSNVSATTVTVFQEREDGTPIQVDYTQDMSHQQAGMTLIFDEEGITAIARQNDQTNEQNLPLFTGDWLTPNQAGLYFKAALERGDRTIAYSMLDSSGAPKLIEITHEKVGEEELVVDGTSQPVTVWTSTSTSLKGTPFTERYDADGVMVAQDISLGFGKMRVRRCSREQALNTKPEQAPELLVATFVKPDTPIKRLRSATGIQMRLRLKDGKPLELPSTGSQRATMSEDGKSALVTVGWNHDGDEWKEESPEDMSEYLKPSMMINCDDERVQNLAERSVRMVEDDAFFKAEAMRRFVQEHIRKKDLEVAFATAGEVARKGAGDCSEHAVLLAALLRANKIPSRVVMGLVYADAFAGKRDIFGWHMWTQAWINHRWIDLDATLLQQQFHPGHIAVSVSSLAQGVADEGFSTLLQIMGQLEIEIVNVEYINSAKPSAAR